MEDAEVPRAEAYRDTPRVAEAVALHDKVMPVRAALGLATSGVSDEAIARACNEFAGPQAPGTHPDLSQLMTTVNELCVKLTLQSERDRRVSMVLRWVDDPHFARIEAYANDQVIAENFRKKNSPSK